LSLAAHSVLMAGDRNPSAVGGLEITFWEDGGLIDWSVDSPELRQLADRSKQIDTYVKNSSLGSNYSMNLRHATALALVGWYLMVPPQVDS
jgi:hypothetical protein